jgi:hypothetical protein
MKNIKPYEDLWKLVKEYNTKKKFWEEGLLLKIDPEEFERDHKVMFSTANKLVNKFNEAESKAAKPQSVA